MRARPHLGPVRTCVGCGARDAQGELLRLRLTVDGRLSDAGRNGRSAYVHALVSCARDLVRSKRLTRALRANVAHDVRSEFAGALVNRLVESAGEIGTPTVCRR